MNTTEIIIALKERHDNLVAQIDTVLSNKTAGIHIGDTVVEHGTDKHKGIIAAFHIFKSLVGEFPVEITQNDDEDE